MLSKVSINVATAVSGLQYGPASTHILQQNIFTNHLGYVYGVLASQLVCYIWISYDIPFFFLFPLSYFDFFICLFIRYCACITGLIQRILSPLVKGMDNILMNLFGSAMILNVSDTSEVFWLTMIQRLERYLEFHSWFSLQKLRNWYQQWLE